MDFSETIAETCDMKLIELMKICESFFNLDPR